MQVSGGVNSNSPASPQSRRFWSSPLKGFSKKHKLPNRTACLGNIGWPPASTKSHLHLHRTGQRCPDIKKGVGCRLSSKLDGPMVQRVKAFLYPLGLLHGPFPARPFLFAVPHDTSLQFQAHQVTLHRKVCQGSAKLSMEASMWCFWHDLGSNSIACCLCQIASWQMDSWNILKLVLQYSHVSQEDARSILWLKGKCKHARCVQVSQAASAKYNSSQTRKCQQKTLDRKTSFNGSSTCFCRGSTQFFNLGHDEAQIHQGRPLGDALELLDNLNFIEFPYGQLWYVPVWIRMPHVWTACIEIPQLWIVLQRFGMLLYEWLVPVTHSLCLHHGLRCWRVLVASHDLLNWPPS